MNESPRAPFRGVNEDTALRAILEGTAGVTGERFFAALVRALSEALGADGAWVTEYFPESRRLRSLAFWMNGAWVGDYEYCIDNTPCAPVIDEGRLVHIPDNIVRLYPGDNDLGKFRAVSYMGAPLLDAAGRVLGHLAVLDSRPMPEEPRCMALFRIFAARAAAEHRRLDAEARVREREQKLSRLVDSAMDAIVEFDRQGRVTLMNAAATAIFHCPAADAPGREFSEFLDTDSRYKLARLMKDLESRDDGPPHLWIAGGLRARASGGEEFPAEATLARFEAHGHPFFTLILRDVNDRLNAERTIRSLRGEAEYLREELHDLGNFGEIIGRSRALRDTLRAVEQVAPTDATALILGETGTGKELIARAIHDAGARREKPFIKVNCAAIPAALIESEFFGHEQGAFTGATRKRQGRFALADGGTIFLDEVGELPIDLQSKLLRVLQEGEFEPVGGTRTVKVDARVIAATNRDLAAAVARGEFREDLYYRLNVFPIHVPPLRERGDDIVLLAEAFARTFAAKMARPVAPLAPEWAQRLKAYRWPGNIRELQNVIERAVIASEDGRLALDRAFPDSPPPATSSSAAAAAPEPVPDRILTAREMLDLERRNIESALRAAGGRVSGPKGAAAMLGMNPSTMSSRIKALGIERPA